MPVLSVHLTTMKITFLDNTFQKGKRTPDIYFQGQSYDVPDEMAEQYIDEKKAVKFVPPKPEKEDVERSEKKAKKEDK